MATGWASTGDDGHVDVKLGVHVRRQGIEEIARGPALEVRILSDAREPPGILAQGVDPGARVGQRLLRRDLDHETGRALAWGVFYPFDRDGFAVALHVSDHQEEQVGEDTGEEIVFASGGPGEEAFAIHRGFERQTADERSPYLC